MPFISRINSNRRSKALPDGIIGRIYRLKPWMMPGPTLSLLLKLLVIAKVKNSISQGRAEIREFFVII